MKKFIFSNALWGILLSLLTLFFYFTGSGIETIESKFYDFRSKLRAENLPKTEFAIIEIDDESISKIGRWPWSRDKMSDMIVWLSSAPSKPSVIGLNILFSEEEKNDGLKATQFLKEKYTQLLNDKKIKEKGKDSEFLKAVEKINQSMNMDSKLAKAIIDAENVVLPMFMTTDNLMNKPEEAPSWIQKFALETEDSDDDEGFLMEGSAMTVPIEVLSSSAAGIGHVNVFSEPDGTIRREYPFIAYDMDVFPSFALEVVRKHLKRNSNEIIIMPGHGISIGKYTMPLDASSSMLVSYNDGETSFKTYSFYDVINGKVVPEAFRDKIVLIGPTAQGIGSLYVTPLEKNLSAVKFTANIIENILHNNYIVRPTWSFYAELALIFLVAIFITFILPKLKALIGAILAGVLLGAMVAGGIFLFVSKGEWLKVTHPSFLLIAGYIFVVSKRFFTTEKSKELVEVGAIETNKMLGLSFQGQGMLDLSFEKFRLCPIDDNMKDSLYNLALDFERKRQFNKAVAVYEHISKKDSKYKDIDKKIETLQKASDGAVFGGSLAGPSSDSTILVDGATTTPTLGRYEISKELGKGAMGIVYLGKDPQINRQVAIKTLRFEEGIDEEQLKALKERFFREAQAAGNLSHPNIIKVYDAGEDQEIAYMAIELLKGEDLKTWTPKKNLLPIDKVCEYIHHCADALDYAHKNGVIHRDIKPANIMLLEDGNIRIVDFGIARIQESSKTATGTVMGTPYYMSPEQISGKKVDGRADIFSLGVTFFELLTGEKPWKGGDAVGTLFFQIASDPYPDPIKIRPDLPKAILAIIDKALQKNPDERYQEAGQMAADLKAVIENKTPTNAGTSSGQTAQTAAPQTAKASVDAKPAVAAKTTVQTSQPKPVLAIKPNPAIQPQTKPTEAKPIVTPKPAPAIKQNPAMQTQVKPTEAKPIITPKPAAVAPTPVIKPSPTQPQVKPAETKPAINPVQSKPAASPLTPTEVPKPNQTVKPAQAAPMASMTPALDPVAQPKIEVQEKPAALAPLQAPKPLTENAKNIKEISKVIPLTPPEKKEPINAPEQKSDGVLKPQTLTPEPLGKPAEKSTEIKKEPSAEQQPAVVKSLEDTAPPEENTLELEPQQILGKNPTVAPSAEKNIPTIKKTEIPNEKDINNLGEGPVKQAPLSEALMGGQPSTTPAMETKPADIQEKTDKPDTNNDSTDGEEMAFEKTLPLIYPEEDEK
jgi:eukaryotic-like serine/threonine-protein kinase